MSPPDRPRSSDPGSSRELSPYRLLQDPLPDHYGAFSGGGALEEEDVHLRDYLRVIRKHRRLIAGVFLAIVATTAIVTFTMDPRYTATTRIQIERQAPNVAPVRGVDQGEVAVADRYDFYQTQYKILESRTIAARVIKGLALDVDPRFVESQEPGLVGGILASLRSAVGLDAAEDAETMDEQGVDPRRIDTYLDMLSISPVRNSRLVEVSFTSKFADLSAEIANRHVVEYVSSSLEQKLDVTTSAKEFLEAELAKARDRVNGAEAALNKFRKEKGIIALDGGKSDIVSERLGDLNTRFTEAQADRIRLEGQYELIKRRSYESLPDVAANPLVAQLKQEVSRLEAEVAEFGKRFKPGYPRMAEALAREQQAKARLNAEIAKIVGAIESGYLAAQSREEELARQLETQRTRALDQKDVGAEYDTLAREVGTARELYASLLHRIKDIDVAEEIRVTNVSVIDAATRPVKPSSPRTLLNLSLSSLAGLLIAAGFAFLLEYFDDTLKTPEDVAQRLGLPTLGVVPAFDLPIMAAGAKGAAELTGSRRTERRNELAAVDHGRAETSRELITLSAPVSVVGEAYRTIRTGILLGAAGSPPQVILFTSGAAGEGKTVTAVNQAMTLVQSGGRVLLVDADVRKPRVHKIFGIPNAGGLSTYLAGQSGIEEVLHPISVNGNAAVGVSSSLRGELVVLPSGPLPPNPAELLGSRRMEETLRTLREQFDYIVIDTPPVLPVTDAAILSALADGVVLVVRGQETPTDIARKSRDRLRYVNAKILGVVLNDVDIASGDYDRYHQYYYSYYSKTG